METAVIIANGPSLKNVPNEWLDKYPTFGANRVFLKYNPTYLTLVDVKMVHTPGLREEALAAFPKSKEVFLSKDASLLFDTPLGDNVSVTDWYNVYGEDDKLLPVFSIQPLTMLVSGGTVTYCSFQLAAWKGFQRLLIVGLNHTFRDPRGDHFDPAYNKDVGIPYEKEMTEVSEGSRGAGKWFWSETSFRRKTDQFYAIAAEHFRKTGGEIINCTPDSLCRAFPIRDWRDF